MEVATEALDEVVGELVVGDLAQGSDVHDQTSQQLVS